jgi:hypothetical protein
VLQFLGIQRRSDCDGKTGVQLSAVVEGFDVVKDGVANFGEGDEGLVIDDFMFEAAPEGFDEGVVVAVAFATHGSNQTMLEEEWPVSGTGELHAALGVDDERTFGATLLQRHAQDSQDKASVESLMHGPTDSAAGTEGQHGVSPTWTFRKVSNKARCCR